MVFSFELGPHAPGISEGIVCSKQGSARGRMKSLFCIRLALAGSQAERAV